MFHNETTCVLLALMMSLLGSGLLQSMGTWNHALTGASNLVWWVLEHVCVIDSGLVQNIIHVTFTNKSANTWMQTVRDLISWFPHVALWNATCTSWNAVVQFDANIKWNKSCSKNSESEQPPSAHPQSIKPKLDWLHPISTAVYKNPERSNVRNLGNEVPQA